MKVAVVLLVSAVGWVSIWVLGAVVSTDQVNDAGLASAFPALSTARTSKLWEPSPSPLSSRGEEHGAKAPASSLHSNEATPEPPGSDPEKVKLAAALLVSAVGWVSIWVLGAVVSLVIVLARLAAVASGVGEAEAQGVGALAEVDRVHLGAVAGRRRAVGAGVEDGARVAVGAADPQAEGAALVGVPADFARLPRSQQRFGERVDRHRRRGGVDAPGEARGAAVFVAGLIHRPHFEAMGAVAEAAQFPRRGARREGAGVELAFEGGDAGAAAVGAGEGEGRGRDVDQRRGVGVDLGLGVGRVLAVGERF